MNSDYVVVIAPDCTPEQIGTRVKACGVTFLSAPGLARQTVSASSWNDGCHDELSEHALVKTTPGRPADGAADTSAHIVSRVLPPEWFTNVAGIGVAAECADWLHAYLNTGADEIVVQGGTTDLLGPVLDASRLTN